MRVSTIIPFYNRSSLTERALNSVLEQNLEQCEVILVDDGSTDDTSGLLEICEERGLTFLRQEQSGVSRARNQGVAAAKGEYIAFLDSDDRWLPGKLERQLAFHSAHPALQISQTEEIWIRNSRRVNPGQRHAQPSGEAFFRSLELCCISPSSVLLRRSLFESSGGFDERMRVCEDYDLWLRISCTEQVGLIAEPLVEKYGGHEDQLSRSEPAIDRFRIFSLLKILGSGVLNNEQETAAAEMLRAKCRVLLMGAERRKNTALCAILEEIRSCSKKGEWSGYEQHCELLSNELLSN